MKTLIACGIFFAGLSTQAVADGTSDAANRLPAAYAKNTVVISCFRGPLVETIWDHPEGVFVDSLVALGYDFASAEAIATRICKDGSLVNDDVAIKAKMKQILREAPRKGRRH